MANAGADIVIVFPKDSAVLDGSSSKDPDGKIVSNHWAKISGGVFAISKNDSQKTVVDRLLVGIYAFELTVTDDGKGFDVKKQLHASGLANMRERVASINGNLVIESTIGRGTKVIVTIHKQTTE